MRIATGLELEGTIFIPPLGEVYIRAAITSGTGQYTRSEIYCHFFITNL